MSGKKGTNKGRVPGPEPGAGSGNKRNAKNAAIAAIEGASAAEVALEGELRLPEKRKNPSNKAKRKIIPDEDEEDEDAKGEEGEDEEVPEEEGDERGDEPTQEEEEEPPRKKKKVKVVHATEPGEEDEIVCMACRHQFPMSARADGIFCPGCRLIPSVGANEIANKVRAKFLMGPAAGDSAADTSQSNKHNQRVKLPAYETELRTLLERAQSLDVIERFRSAEGIHHTEAIAEMRTGSYIGAACEHQPKDLTELIRSGRFKELSLALPRTLAEVQNIQESKEEEQQLVFSAGGISASSKRAQHRPLVDLEEFLRVGITTILPTLIDRPRAMLDWMQMSRSVIEVSKKEGWIIARAYYNTLMNDRIPSMQPFNQFDFNLFNSARAAAAASPIPQRQAPVSGAENRPPLDPFGQIHNMCRAYNFFPNGCSRSECKFIHKCGFPGCAISAEGHRSMDCPLKPNGFKAPVPLTGPAGPPRRFGRQPGSGGGKGNRA